MAEHASRSRTRPQAEAPAPKHVEAPLCQVCGIKLSSYNPGPNCWHHTIGYPWRGPTAKPKY